MPVVATFTVPMTAAADTPAAGSRRSVCEAVRAALVNDSRVGIAVVAATNVAGVARFRRNCAAAFDASTNDFVSTLAFTFTVWSGTRGTLLNPARSMTGVTLTRTSSFMAASSVRICWWNPLSDGATCTNPVPAE
jgi:hypothetical protein